MNCIYCGKLVYGENGMNVPNLGVAHQQCFQAYQTLKRTFQNLDITALNDQELVELKDLVLTELNSRQRDSIGDIELF